MRVVKCGAQYIGGMAGRYSIDEEARARIARWASLISRERNVRASCPALYVIAPWPARLEMLAARAEAER